MSISYKYTLKYSKSRKVFLSFDEIHKNFIVLNEFSKDKYTNIDLQDGIYQGFYGMEVSPIVKRRHPISYEPMILDYSNYEIKGTPLIFVVFDKQVISYFFDICLNKYLSSFINHEYIYSSALARKYNNAIQAFYNSTNLPMEIYTLIFSFLPFDIQSKEPLF